MKSACRAATIPETTLPTLTVVTAESVPVAVTVCVTLPLSTLAVRYFGARLLAPEAEDPHEARQDERSDGDDSRLLHLS